MAEARDCLLETPVVPGDQGPLGPVTATDNEKDNDRTVSITDIMEEETGDHFVLDRESSINEMMENASLRDSSITEIMSESRSSITEITDGNVDSPELLENVSDEEQVDIVEQQQPDNLALDKDWCGKDKHMFVLSEAGKPIFCLHGSEEQLVPMFALMQALVSVVAVTGDTIRSVRSKGTNIVFVVKPPLILVGVARSARYSCMQLTVQLTYMHNQILSTLTSSQLNKIFEQRRNYDLRRMLTGSERLLDHLASFMDRDPCFMLSAVRCLPLQPQVRDLISESIIRFCGKIKNVVFGILMADNQLVTLVRIKKYYIHPADLHLLFNLVNSSESFKNSESWTPICLPKFDSTGFLHAHVSYLSDTCQACLLLLTVDHAAFFPLSEARSKIVERLIRHKTLDAITTAMSNSSYTTSSIDVPEMRHFMYKSRTSAQFTAPLYTAPYNTPEQRERLLAVYLTLQNRFYSGLRPLKLVHYFTQSEVVLGWMTQAFELYAVFSPTASKLSVITSVNKLLRWIKKEEDKHFILTAPTF